MNKVKRLIVLFTLLLLPLSSHYVFALDFYRVVIRELNVRSMPSASGRLLGKLKHGDKIEVESISRGWAKFLHKGNNAYVSATYLELIEKEQQVQIDTTANHTEQSAELEEHDNQTSTFEFTPRPELSNEEIKERVYKADPYTLYRKGSVAEYAFSDGNMQVSAVKATTAYYVRQAVSDIQINQGLYQAIVLQSYYNKSGARILDKRAFCVESFYPTEIDCNGVFHMTHDIINDFFFNIKSRTGYAFIVPAYFSKNVQLPSSSITEDILDWWKSKKTVTSNYTDACYQGEEEVTTPAGTFKCAKITYNFNSSIPTKKGQISYNATIWLARSIGLVKAICEKQSCSSDGFLSYNLPPKTIYLNQLLLK